MIGALPSDITVRGRRWEIRTDYRDVLRVFVAFRATELNDREKFYVCLRQMIKNFDHLDPDGYTDAYRELLWFLSGGEPEDNSDKNKKRPELINWEKDERLIFPTINKIAGCEIRALQYMHWWTFLGYFQEVDRDGIWGTVLTIRQKRAKKKKLEKWELEFYNANPLLCEVEKPKSTAEKRGELDKLFQDLLKKQQTENQQ